MNYGFTSNNEEITESMVEEFYRIAEQEILPNTTLYIMCDGKCSIDEDSFTYYNTGTAFGPLVNLTINCTANKDTFPSLDFIKSNKNTSIANYNNDKHRFEIDAVINMDGCKTNISYIVCCYPYGEYNEEESNRFYSLMDKSFLDKYFTELSAKVYNQIVRSISNIWGIKKWKHVKITNRKF